MDSPLGRCYKSVIQEIKIEKIEFYHQNSYILIKHMVYNMLHRSYKTVTAHNNLLEACNTSKHGVLQAVYNHLTGCNKPFNIMLQ